MQKFLTWLLRSSRDPNKYSSTVTNAIVFIIPGLLLISHLANLSISEGDLTAIAEGSGNVVKAILDVIAVATTAWSVVGVFISRVRATIAVLRGTHASLNNLESQD